MKTTIGYLIITLLCLTIAKVSKAQDRSSKRQYTKEFSAMINPGFEQGYKGWTITGCTRTLTAQVPFLGNSLRLTCAAETFSIKQNTTKLTGMAGQQGVGKCEIKTTASGVKFRTLSNDSEVDVLDVPIGNVVKREIPNVVNGTSNGIEVFADAAFTGTVDIDNCGFGVAPDGYFAKIPRADVLVFARSNGGTALVANVSNIDWITEETDDQDLWDGTTFTPTISGYYKIEGFTRITLSSDLGMVAYIDGSPSTRCGFDSGLTRHLMNCSLFLEAGEALTIRPTATVTLAVDSQDHWISISKESYDQAAISSKTPAELATFCPVTIDNNGSTATIADDIYGCVSSVTRDNQGEITVNLNTDIFSVAPNVVGSIEETNRYFSIQGAATASSFVARTQTESGARADVNGLKLHIAKDGSDLEQSRQIVGSFSDIPKLSTQGKEIREDVCRIINSGAASLYTGNPFCDNWMDTPTRTGAGVVTVVFDPAYSTPPECYCQSYQPRRSCTLNTPTTTGVTASTYDISGASLDDRDFSIKCIGER